MKKCRKLRREINWWKKNQGLMVIIAAIVGFGLGILFSIDMLFEFHGPTVTHFGTIIATCIHLACGTAFALGFAWMEGGIIVDTINSRKEELEAQRGLY